ncbi:L domain-like protein [Gonapodya prolifera JEL478]|uniref:L domain-like protein n=1 Tax=Gonapodya prolifera (strain JEL478) TaxID=1344416 RepID=A0A139AX63_GONPJ|nr:L domain-like protein [Gonapodya prolifera JEL478]|eukprot:KXS21297.1 L domain-like protein [Gonapodya prolifera JEL478]
MRRNVWLPSLLAVSLLLSTPVLGQAPQDCVSIFAMFKAANVPITPAAAQTDCCQFYWASGTDANADDYYENFVNCDGGRVTRFQLENYNVGTLDYFQNLTGLLRLNLINAGVTGALPTWLPTLTNLTRISIGDNSMTGSTEVLGQLPNLSDLILRNNSFSGSLAWISSATNLQILSIGYNQFSGDFPSISRLTKLTTVNIGNNAFTGPLPDPANFPMLSSYYVFNNRFSGAIPSISKNTNLVTFNVNNNSLTGSAPDPSNSPKLTYYGVQFNSGLTGNLPDGIFSLRNLDSLILASCSFKGSLGAGLSDMTTLETLWLDHNPGLTGNLPDLRKLTKLSSLDFSSTGLSGPLLLASNTGSTYCDVSNSNLCLSGGSINSIPNRCQTTGGGSKLPACPAGTVTTTAGAAGGTGTGSSPQGTGTATSSGGTNSNNAASSPGGGSSIGPIIGGVVGGIAALLILAGAAFFLLRRKNANKSVETPQAPPSQPPQPYPQLGQQQQYSQSMYAPSSYPASPPMAAVPYMQAPPSHTSLASSAQQQYSNMSGSIYSGQGYGMSAHLLAAPGSVGTVGTTTSTNSTKVNEVYIVGQPYVATQQDELTCQPGEKVFVSDLFVDEWCKGLNLETMQSGMIPYAVLVPANQPSQVQSRMMSGSVYQPHARGQSVGVSSQINLGDQGLASLRTYLDRGIINSQQYQTGSAVLTGNPNASAMFGNPNASAMFGNPNASAMFGDVKGPGV